MTQQVSEEWGCTRVTHWAVPKAERRRACSQGRRAGPMGEVGEGEGQQDVSLLVGSAPQAPL